MSDAHKSIYPENKSPPVCCFCDADLSCGRCGVEQPYDDISILKARIKELEGITGVAQSGKVPVKENDLARFFLGIVVSERKGIGDVFDSAKDFLAKYEVTVRGSELSSTESRSEKDEWPLYSATIAWSDEDQAYIGAIPELPGCMADGQSPEECIRELRDAKAAWIEACRTAGNPLPTPRPFAMAVSSPEGK